MVSCIIFCLLRISPKDPVHVVVRADGHRVPDIDLDQVPVVLAVHREAVDVGVFFPRSNEHQPINKIRRLWSFRISEEGQMWRDETRQPAFKIDYFEPSLETVSSNASPGWMVRFSGVSVDLFLSSHLYSKFLTFKHACTVDFEDMVNVQS